MIREHVRIASIDDAVAIARIMPYGSREHLLASTLCLGAGIDPNAQSAASSGLMNWQEAIVGILIERALIRELDISCPDMRPIP